MKIDNLEDKAMQVLTNALVEIPFIQVKGVKRNIFLADKRLEADALVELKVSDDEQLLLIEVKGSGQPRIVRSAVNQIFRLKDFFPGSYGVVIAPYISPGSAEICKKEGVGYADLAGNCFLNFVQVYIKKEGNPNPFTENRELRSLFSPKSSRVVRALLMNPKKRWKVQDFAKETDVSLGLVSRVKKLLNDREWIQANKEGFLLSSPEALLEEWTNNYNYRRNEIYDCYSLKAIAEIEANIAEVCRRENIHYALTGFSGAARLAPFVKYKRAMVYVEGNIDKLASVLSLRRVSSGANVSLLEPFDKGIFYRMREVDGINIVSPVQIYLDVKGLPGRGQEAADVVLEEVIKKQW